MNHAKIINYSNESQNIPKCTEGGKRERTVHLGTFYKSSLFKLRLYLFNYSSILRIEYLKKISSIHL